MKIFCQLIYEIKTYRKIKVLATVGESIEGVKDGFVP